VGWELNLLQERRPAMAGSQVISTAVVPAKAGTHAELAFPRPSSGHAICSLSMGPRLRGDDVAGGVVRLNSAGRQGLMVWFR
jgi:hypothetical protein